LLDVVRQPDIVHAAGRFSKAMGLLLVGLVGGTYICAVCTILIVISSTATTIATERFIDKMTLAYSATFNVVPTLHDADTTSPPILLLICADERHECCSAKQLSCCFV
jgi:hypothetical protein